MGQKERKQSGRGAGRAAHDVTPAGAPTPGGHARQPGDVWVERTLLGLDLRGWRGRRLDEHRSKAVLENLRAYVSDALAGGSTGTARPGHGAARAKTRHEHGTARAMARAADGDLDGPELPPDCELVKVEFRECEDPQGLPHLCRCELYECPTQSFWLCTIID